MRSLQVSPSLARRLGGPATNARALLRALRDHGVDAHLWSSDALCDDVDRAAASTTPARLFRAVGRVQLSIGLLFEVLRRCTDFDIVIVHGPYVIQSALAATVCRWRHVPFVIQAHGSVEPHHRQHHRGRKGAYEALVLRRLMGQAAFIACASAAEAVNVKAAFPNSAPVVVGLGVPNSWLAAEPRRQPARTIGFVGRFAAKKGLPLLVRAYRLACADPRFSNHRLRLALAGRTPGSVASEVEQLTAECALDEVRIEGQLDGERLTDFYDTLDVFCLPSENENFAVAVLEACARGVPVIVSKEVALAGAVADYDAGVVLQERTERAIVAGLAQLVLSEDRYRSYSANALELARALSWDRVGEQWRHALTDATTARSVRA
jgi:glycosyltransferase involved in cell wall biosynthesis